MLRFQPLGHRATCRASKAPRVLPVICFVVAGADSASFASVAFLTLTWDVQHRTPSVLEGGLPTPGTLSPSPASPVAGAVAAPLLRTMPAGQTLSTLLPSSHQLGQAGTIPSLARRGRRGREPPSTRAAGRSLSSSFHASFCPGPGPVPTAGVRPAAARPGLAS